MPGDDRAADPILQDRSTGSQFPSSARTKEEGRDAPRERPAPKLSIIIPTLNEEGNLPGLLADLAGLRVAYEAIVSDGGSGDATRAVAEAAGARVVVGGEAGRGVQLRAGAEAARAPLLCFLHADVRLDAPALRRLEAFALAPPARAAAFRLRIGSPRRIYRVLEAGTHLRSRLAGLPYGDQGLLLTATDYWDAGGHPDLPLMEDVALIRKLRRWRKIDLLDEVVTVSPRRWEATGPLRRTFINLSLLGLYLLGVSPARLANLYPPPPDRADG